MHRRAFELDEVEVVGVTDVDAERGQRSAADLGTVFYPGTEELLERTRPDVAVIITPHPFHAELAIACMEAGYDVLVEKPMAVHVGEADAMVAASERTGRLLAVVFQLRLSPEIRVARDLITRGELGAIQHVDLRSLALRTDAYFQHAPWLGTWSGEGGGVVMNQAPHALDLLCHLFGRPRAVTAWTRTQVQRIETEDTAHAMVEGSDGSLWSVHVSTAETGQPQRLEITGTAGRLQIAGGELTHHRFDTDVREHIRTNPERMAPVGMHEVAVDLAAGTGDHAAVYRDLHRALRTGTPVACDGRQARDSLELANAIIYSGQTGEQVRLPLDLDAYAALLDELRAGSNRSERSNSTST